MIKITILYPSTPGSKFDFDYYLNVHMPMAIELLGPAMEAITVERVINPGAPWPVPDYVAICSFLCRSREDFEAAFFPHMEALQADVANYTDTQQQILISEVEVDTGSASRKLLAAS